MTYSFTINKPTKQEALDAAPGAFDLATQGQAIHEKDKDLAVATIKAYLDLLPEDKPETEVSVYVSGYIATEGDVITSASVNVQVSSFESKPSVPTAG